MGQENTIDFFALKVWFVKWQFDILMIKDQYRQMKNKEV